MLSEIEKKRLIAELAYKKANKKATHNFKTFISQTKPDYVFNWHHIEIIEKLEAFIKGDKKKLMLFLPPQHGKLISHDTPILTSKGWSTHGNLLPGDFVFNEQGEPIKVIALSIEGETDMEVKFTDGSVISCHSNHEWKVKYNKRKWQVMETRQMDSIGVWNGEPGKRGGRGKFQVRENVCIQFPKISLPIDPYTLGAWIGDGSTHKNCITYHPNDVSTIHSISKKYGSPKESIHKDTGIKTAYFTPLYKLLKDNDLLGFKHIPEDYLISSKEQRLELLAGLIDTDGYVYHKNGRVTFSNINKRVIEDVRKLCVSLGFRVTICEFDPILSTSGIQGKNTVYQLCFNPDLDIPCRIQRKKIIKKNPKKCLRSIKEIIKAKPKKGRCIQVEGGVYLVGDNLVPTHNSEIVSRRLPDWVLGMNPDTKIAACSYSSTLAASFNRDVQRIIIGEGYDEIFPETTLNNSSSKSAGGYLRNSDIFEVVDKAGFYKSTGVGGSLTGTTVDLGIIDDPVKDRKEANSIAYRNSVWDWYVDVFKSRLHNDSKQIILMTRWHEDDLAGRLLKREPDDWEVIKYPAIAEKDEEHRKAGEALWPERHSLKKLLETKELNPHTFESLYQQNPTIKGGNIIKAEWFGTFRYSDIPEGIRKKATFDLAYTAKEENDPTGCLTYAKHENNFYIFDYTDVRMQYPDLMGFLPDYYRRNGIRMGYIENKGPGISAVQSVRRDTSLNVSEYKVGGKKKVPNDKVARLYDVIGYLEGKRVFLLEGASWIPNYMQAVTGFPKMKHDEAVDCTTMMLNIEKKGKMTFSR